MRIDNGQRLPLQIDGVFDGMAGVSRGQLAFVPNRAGGKAAAARAGVLASEPVQLLEVSQEGDLYLATYRKL